MRYRLPFVLLSLFGCATASGLARDSNPPASQPAEQADVAELERAVAEAEREAYAKNPFLKTAEEIRARLPHERADAGAGDALNRLDAYVTAVRNELPDTFEELVRALAGSRQMVTEAVEAEWLKEGGAMARMLRSYYMERPAPGGGRRLNDVGDRIRAWDPDWTAEGRTADEVWEKFEATMREHAGEYQANAMRSARIHLPDDQLVEDFITDVYFRRKNEIVTAYLMEHTPKRLLEARQRLAVARKVGK